MKLPIKYNVRNLFVRQGNTFMTIASIAFVVLVFVGVVSMGVGLSSALRGSGEPDIVIVLREGARSETESSFDKERQRLLASFSGLARDAAGEPLACGEVVTLQIFQRADGKESNVALRGIEPAGIPMRRSFRIVEGRIFTPGVSEVIVGRKLAQRFPDLRLGRDVEFGRMQFKVVGVFETAASFDSEVWGALEDMGSAFRREDVSSMWLRAESPDGVQPLIARVQGDQRLKLQAKTLTQYFAEQTTATASQFRFLGTGLAVLMAIGACFAAANTMYAHVAARGKEIGTLRAMGFKRRSILGAFLLEAALLGLVAGILGAILALPLNGLTTGTTNFVTFSELSFSVETSPVVLAEGVVLAVLTAVLGGLPPAWGASRRSIALLLRES